MTAVPLTTYLRTHRRRTGLTHDEVAFLLGGMCGTNVCRHETAKRFPSLQTLMMYEVIFDANGRELFAGVFAEMQVRVRRRASGLLLSLERKPPSAAREQKLRALRRMLGTNGSVIAERRDV